MAREGIHPTYYKEAKVTCACGNTFTVGSTQPELRVEICYKCHPFFTGQEKLVDTEGRVERFEKKRKAAEVRTKKTEEKKKAEEVKEKEQETRPRNLKELLEKG
ncbi:50S ribosomal protein L31 [candidate division WWE3 bacterium CG09_land_8_20_14_0_10_47_33]|nr:MAG: 50S ribosomal protein L31 [candidate division WWE3 bacterium CG09_land_8_20_14_0_10_47_33]PIZ40962.1 MAG: 50S ribosomal protein L31 [candidate division WWE3 bacterium CG_4_10_14_0_2_um_filter_47_8]PJE50869.1 MAG: 50S ribosomal protein L31 [candidate division WWE3 bacterium CG10_big_fil_rev_8_21_14_0_10_48_23]